MRLDYVCNKKDKRLLVLLALGAGILSTGLFAPKLGIHSCYYNMMPSGSLKFPVVVRATKEVFSTSDLDVVKLSAETACADTPPQLALFFNLPLPVNRADANTLTMLPGIGPRLAENIVMFRREQGKISGPEVLTRIDGIGKKMTERLATMVCFD